MQIDVPSDQKETRVLLLGLLGPSLCHCETVSEVTLWYEESSSLSKQEMSYLRTLVVPHGGPYYTEGRLRDHCSGKKELP